MRGNARSVKLTPERVAEVPWKIQRLSGEDAWEHRVRVAREVMAAAHDPALGLDGSTCKRAVVEWMEQRYAAGYPGAFALALAFVHDFGSGDA